MPSGQQAGAAVDRGSATTGQPAQYWTGPHGRHGNEAMNGSSPPFTPAAAATAAASFQEQQQYFEQQQQQQYFDQHGMAWGYESPHFQQPMQPLSLIHI